MIEIMKQIKWIVCLLAAALVLSCDSLVEDYKFDTEGYGTKDWDIIDYCESEVAYQMASYGKAMRLAGMEDVLAQGNLTCVIPNDDAFAAFVGESGYGSLEEVPAPVLRDLLMYLIFPGDHRCLTMEPGEVRTVNSLRGEPISIKRSENEKSYAMTINGENDLPNHPVESQDYQFKNNIVGQLVTSMPYYKPISIPQPAPIPEGFVSNGETMTIPVSEDTFVYGSGSAKTAPQNNTSNGLRIRNQSGYYGMGLLRFRVPQNKLMEDLVLAKVCMSVYKLDKAYNTPGTEANVSLHDICDEVYNTWDETTATYSAICEKQLKNYAYLIKTDGKGITKANTFWVGEHTFYSGVAMPYLAEIPMTASVKKNYENGAKDADGNVVIEYVIYNKNHGLSTSGLGIFIHDKDYYKNGATLVLKGPEASKLTIGANNPLVTEGPATQFTDEVLVINTPDAAANPDGYDYSSQNIILQLAEEPACGTLTRYGLPVRKNQSFTYYEMANGFVKYVRGAEAQPDSFKVKVLDYLDCMILDPVVVTVQ